MAENSKIEWTDHTFNPWRGCTKVSDGCNSCYADSFSKRNPKTLGVWGKYGTRVVASEAMWKEPVKWNRKAEAEGVRKRVFCASLADVFEGNETLPDDTYHLILEARKRLWDLIEQTRHLDWLLLTKRPQNAMKITPERWRTKCTFKGEPAEKFPSNVWIGTSVEDQKTADERIPELLKIPAKVRFLSMEPLLGPVDLPTTVGCVGRCSHEHHPELALDWVIVGGESGSKARPMHPDWVRSIRDQCIGAEVPFFFKQLGAWAWSRPTVYEPHFWLNADGRRTTDDSVAFEDGGSWQGMINVGKKKSGRELDGRTWDEFPKV